MSASETEVAEFLSYAFRNVELPALTSNDVTSIARGLDDYADARRGAGTDGTKAPAKSSLHPRTAQLVADFSAALAEKLMQAERKYGRVDDWARDDWEAECRQALQRSVAKGDPLDVAAYAAFCWSRGWPTSSPSLCREQGLLIEVVDGSLVISIGVDALMTVVRGGDRWDDETMTIVDPDVFAVEIAKELENNEQEDGTTDIHLAIDAAAEHAIEGGSRAVRLVDDGDE